VIRTGLAHQGVIFIMAKKFWITST
jgi:hypothetical protein